MTEYLLISWICLNGVLWMGMSSPNLPVGAVAALGPGLGYVIFVLMALPLAAAGKFGIFISLAAGSIAGIPLTVLALANGAARRRTVQYLLAGTAVTAILVTLVFVWVTFFNGTRLTKDSIRYLIIAASLESSGSLPTIGASDILKRMLAIPVLHTPGIAAGAGYSKAITPLSGVLTCTALLWIGSRALSRFKVSGKHQIMAAGLVLFLLLSTNRIIYMFWYVNGHMFFALFLLTAVGTVWLSLTERQPGYLFPASLAFASLAVLRPEGAMISAVFLTPLLASPEVSRRNKVLTTLPFGLAALFWYGVMLPSYLPANAGAFNAIVPGYLFLAFGMCLLAVSADWPPLRRCMPAMPWVIVVLLAVVLLVLDQIDRDIFRASLNALVTNARPGGKGLWMGLWAALAITALGGAFMANSKDRAVLLAGILAFFLLLLVFPSLRSHHYRVGESDSGNRMLLHIVPVVVLFIYVIVGNALSVGRGGNIGTSRPAE